MKTVNKLRQTQCVKFLTALGLSVTKQLSYTKKSAALDVTRESANALIAAAKAASNNAHVIGDCRLSRIIVSPTWGGTLQLFSVYRVEADDTLTVLGQMQIMFMSSCPQAFVLLEAGL